MLSITAYMGNEQAGNLEGQNRLLRIAGCPGQPAVLIPYPVFPLPRLIVS